MRRRIPLFVAVIETILLFTHFFIYETWTFFRPAYGPALLTLRIAFAVLSVSFVIATLLAFRSDHPLVKLLYTLAAVWLGLLNFFFLASVLCWLAYPFAALAGWRQPGPGLAATFFALAVLATAYAIINAARPRVRRVAVKLRGLPASWRGRVAALLSDTHLGHVRGRRFFARVIAQLQRLHPDVIFFPGDMYDGTRVNADALATTWKNISPPLGIYFVTGNHEEFTDPAQYCNALERSGVRVLHNEKVMVDGLQLLGARYGDSADPARFSAILDRADLDRSVASVLLLHVPHHLAISEQHGVSLQLCGHTHGGQIFPFTLFVSRIFGKFAHGLHHHGAMAVYTSYGAGTWGPPLRLGTIPEIILIRFD